MIERRARPEACLSDFAFDRRLAGELAAEEAAAATAHLASCTRCSARAEVLVRARNSFAAEAPALRLPLKKAASPRTAAKLYVVLAVAAALLIGVRFPAQPDDVGTRAKGRGPRIDYYVSHAGIVRHGATNERVTPGDRVRFVVAATEATDVAILSVDGAKNVSVYYPSGPLSVRVPAGDDVALPESTTLDTTLGDETIYAVFCAHAFAVAPLRAALEAAPRKPLAAAGDCSVEVIRWRKDASIAP